MKKEIGEYVLHVEQDEAPFNPRTEYDNLSKMICFHNRYDLGDKHDFKSKDYLSWAEMKKGIEKEFNIAVILPLYLYDHSGITMKTTPFSCIWDSGQVGWIYITKEKLRSEFGKKRLSKQLIEKGEKILLGEVETYDDYLTGNVWRYNIWKKDDTDEISIASCGGFFGDIDNCMKEAERELPKI
jgi:hypothetical protein